MDPSASPIVGTGKSDALSGTDGDDRLFGAAGDDELEGLAGDDLVRGGVGDDKLDGGEGNDTLAGGLGADLFVFSVDELLLTFPFGDPPQVLVRTNLGHDVVTDFEPGVDRLVVRGLDGAPWAPALLASYLQLAEVDVDGDGRTDTVITLDHVDPATGIRYTDPTSSITLLGVSGYGVPELFTA